MKNIENKLDFLSNACNAKEYYQSFIRKKHKKSAKQWEIVTYQSKTFEKPNIADIKSVIEEYPKTLLKLCKTEKVGSKSSLPGDTKKGKIFYTKIVKVTNMLLHMLLKTMEVIIMLKF